MSLSEMKSEQQQPRQYQLSRSHSPCRAVLCEALHSPCSMAGEAFGDPALEILLAACAGHKSIARRLGAAEASKFGADAK